MIRRTRGTTRDPDLDPFEDDGELESASEVARERVRLLVRDLLVRWHWVVLFLIVGILCSFYYLSKAPKIYETTSTILVKQMASTVISDDRDEDLDLRSDDAVNTVAQRIKRPGLLSAVAALPEVSELNGFIPTPTNWFPSWAQSWLGSPGNEDVGRPQTPEALGKTIANWTRVQVRKNTRLLDITVSHPSPEVAKWLADAIAKEYISELSGNRIDGRITSSKILTSQAEEARLGLQNAQNALANYQQILETVMELEEKEKIFSDYDRRYLHKHPKLIDAKATLDDYQKRFLSEFELIRNAAADRAYWEGTRPEWDQPALDVATRLQIARRLLTARATVLQSEIESKNEVFNTVLTKMQETDIDQKAEEAEVELSNLSELPGKPSSPKTATVLAAGSILGMMIGLALAFLLVQLDNKFHTVSQVEMLSGLPILATIPRTDLKILAGLKAEREKKLKVADPPGMELWDPRLLFRPALLQTLFVEAYRILRASVSLLGKEENRKVTLFSSAIPGDGKTTVATNFAVAAAQQGKKTILIDFDLRKPAIHKGFGVTRNGVSAGITEVLTGKASVSDAVQEQAVQKNLSVLLAGTKAPNPGELLTTEAVADLLEDLKKEFEVIVIDSAPLLAVPDTRLLAPEVDNFCLVVRVEYTPKDAVAKALAMLCDNGTEPSGVVVNAYHEKRGFTRKYGSYGQYRHGYGSGSYGAYTSYGADDDEEEKDD